MKTQCNQKQTKTNKKPRDSSISPIWGMGTESPEGKSNFSAGVLLTFWMRSFILSCGGLSYACSRVVSTSGLPAVETSSPVPSPDLGQPKMLTGIPGVENQ